MKDIKGEVWNTIEGYGGRYQVSNLEAARALGINEKTVRNIRLGKFKTNRKGYIITAIAKGGEAI